jgi:hypothetical protein
MEAWYPAHDDANPARTKLSRDFVSPPGLKGHGGYRYEINGFVEINILDFLIDDLYVISLRSVCGQGRQGEGDTECQSFVWLDGKQGPATCAEYRSRPESLKQHGFTRSIFIRTGLLDFANHNSAHILNCQSSVGGCDDVRVEDGSPAAVPLPQKNRGGNSPPRMPVPAKRL